MAKSTRERFQALSLAELHELAQANSDNKTVIRLLWEIRALHEVGYFAWRVEAEQCFVYPDEPLGAALLNLRLSLRQERWLPEMIAKIKGGPDRKDGW